MIENFNMNTLVYTSRGVLDCFQAYYSNMENNVVKSRFRLYLFRPSPENVLCVRQPLFTKSGGATVALNVSHKTSPRWAPAYEQMCKSLNPGVRTFSVLKICSLYTHGPAPNKAMAHLLNARGYTFEYTMYEIAPCRWVATRELTVHGFCIAGVGPRLV